MPKFILSPNHIAIAVNYAQFSRITSTKFTNITEMREKLSHFVVDHVAVICIENKKQIEFHETHDMFLFYFATLIATTEIKNRNKLEIKIGRNHCALTVCSSGTRTASGQRNSWTRRNYWFFTWRLWFFVSLFIVIFVISWNWDEKKTENKSGENGSKS